MALFRRRHEQPSTQELIPGIPDAAALMGLLPAGDQPFDGRTCDIIREVSRTLHGFPARPLSHETGIPSMFFRDAYRGAVDGRTVAVANVHTPMETMDIRYAAHVHLTSLVAVELPTILTIQGVEPRQRHVAFHGTEVPTGNATFDERFRVVGLDLLGGASGLVTPEMQQLILTRADWAFAAHETTLLSIAKDAFETPEGMGQRIIETLAIVAAFPTSVVPAQVDHSVDDLLTRIDQLDSIDEGIAFLQNLSDADRTRLAQSPSPLARFAQVRTPEEAMSLFMSLPETDRLQILAMFSKATGN